MIKEHGDLVLDINEFLTDIGNGGKYTINYIQDVYYAFEIHLLGWTFTPNAELWMNQHLLDKFNHIVKEIYTIEVGKLYIVYLDPIEQIRTKKINKLQNKITNETDNKI